MKTLWKEDIDFPFTSETHRFKTDNMYMIDPWMHRQHEDSNLDLFHEWFKKLEQWEVKTNRDEVIKFQSVANSIQASIFTTLNEYEQCSSAQEAIINWIKILSSNWRYKEIDFSILHMEEHELWFISLGKLQEQISKAKQSIITLNTKSWVLSDIEHIFSHLLPKIAKNTWRLKSDFIKMWLVHKSRKHKTRNIDMDFVKQTLMSEIDTLEQEYTQRYQRVLLLSDRYNWAKTEKTSSYLHSINHTINSRDNGRYISAQGQDAYADSLANIRKNWYYEPVEMSEFNKERGLTYITDHQLKKAITTDAEIHYQEKYALKK